MGSCFGRVQGAAPIEITNTVVCSANIPQSCSFDLVERADSYDPETKTTTFKFNVDGVTTRVLSSASLLSKKGPSSTFLGADKTASNSQKLVIKVIKFLDIKMAEKVRPTIQLLR